MGRAGRQYAGAKEAEGRGCAGRVAGAAGGVTLGTEAVYVPIYLIGWSRLGGEWHDGRPHPCWISCSSRRLPDMMTLSLSVTTA